jgi:enoyl-CoA hydratase
VTLAYEDFRHLAFERQLDGVLLITINRPERLNAANERLHYELAEVWRTVGDDDGTLAAVITGSGRAFSAGGDLDMVQRNLGDPGRIVRTGREALSIVYNLLDLEKPVISAINGVAVGAGLAVALTADISVIAEDARISDGHTRLGVASGDHSLILWPLLCGMAKAKYHLLLGGFIDGREAERIGLVSLAVPADELLPSALAIAQQLARGPRRATAWTKRCLNHWLRAAAPTFELSVALEMLDFFEEDAAEGVRSLLAKEEPRFPSAISGGG